MRPHEHRYPPHIAEMLKQRGYFEASEQERVESAMRCIRSLEKVILPSHEGTRKALRELRGDDR